MNKTNQSNPRLEWYRLTKISCHPVSVSTFFASLACISIIVYGVEIFNFNLSIDEEVWGEYLTNEEREVH
jgi:hypothetical protein